MDDTKRKGDGKEATESIDTLATGNVDAQVRDDVEETEIENAAATDIREAVSENEDEDDSVCYPNRVLLQLNGNFETVLMTGTMAEIPVSVS